MEIIKDSIAFGISKGTGPRSSSKDVAFSKTISKATAILTGFITEFSGGDDHHIGKLDIFLDTSSPVGNAVRVTARFGLRDWSGDWDDNYDGTVYFAVIAE